MVLGGRDRELSDRMGQIPSARSRGEQGPGSFKRGKNTETVYEGVRLGTRSLRGKSKRGAMRKNKYEGKCSRSRGNWTWDAPRGGSNRPKQSPRFERESSRMVKDRSTYLRGEGGLEGMKVSS